MILATHQPYFFPYIGYFSLISAVDKFVFLDVTQFNRRSWMTRNRILKPNLSEFQYIKVGLQQVPFRALLPECKLENDQKWKIKLFAQLEHYKKKAPYYEETILFLRQLMIKEEDSLADFNVNSTKAVVHLLKIPTSIMKFSEIEHIVGKASGGGYWGINISKALGTDTYINAPDGEAFYPKNDYQKAGIKLGFIQHKLGSYSQKNSNFIIGLSIIDVLMFNGAERTSEMVHDFSIKWEKY